MKKASLLIVLLLGTISIGVLSSDGDLNQEGSNLLNLDENTFKELAKNEKVLVILFQKEGKDAARTLTEFKAVKSLNDSKGLEFTLGVWNSEITAAVNERFKLNKLPAVRVALEEGNKIEEYKGFIDSEKIFSFLKRGYKKWTNKILTVATIEEMEKFANSNIYSLLFFGSKETHPKEHVLFEKLFGKFSNLAGFGQSNSAEITSLFNVSHTPDIMLLNRNDVNTTFFFDLAWDDKSLEHFFNTYVFKQLIILREETDYDSLFVDQEDMLFYARLGPGDDTEKEFNKTRTFFSYKARIIVVDAYSPPGRLLYSWLKKSHEEAPNVFYVRFENNIGRKYVLKENITKSNLILFYNNITAGKLEPIIHSGRVPEQNDGVIKTVVRNNWQEVINDPTKHVCLMFFSHNCRHCSDFKIIYEKIASKFSTKTDLVFAELNIHENDIEDLSSLSVRMVPAVYIYPANEKRNPIEFIFKKGEENFQQYIENTLESLEKKKKKKSKKAKSKETKKTEL